MIRANIPEFMVKLALWLLALIVAVTGSLARAAPPHTPGATVTDDRRPIRERFADLDAYLAYLQKRSHLDGAWYREIRPGVYELQTGNLRLPGATKRTFTREELERKFGFVR
jgi:hypothetical protein